MTIQFDAGGLHFVVTPDDDDIGTNEARALAAIDKIQAAQVAIADDITEANADLVILGGAPTNAQVLAAIIHEIERSRRNMLRLSRVGDYLIAIIRFALRRTG